MLVGLKLAVHLHLAIGKPCKIRVYEGKDSYDSFILYFFQC